MKKSLLAKTGKLYATAGSVCKANLGHDCAANVVSGSSAFTSSDNCLAAFKGYNGFTVAKANSNIALTAGVGKI